MDGTLLDSMEGWATAGEKYLRRRGLTPRGDERDSLLGQGMLRAALYFQEAYGIEDDVAVMIEEIKREVRDYYENEATLCDGVTAFLTKLSEQGVKMCVATATERALAEPVLERLGIRSFFDKIFTCRELDTNKTEPLIYETARAFMGADKAQTWVFEDALYAARTAKAAGYPVCAVYDRFETDAAALTETADLYIRSYREAMDLAY